MIRPVCAVAASLLSAGVSSEALADRLPVMDPGWEVLGRQHVRDGAEKDLAFLKSDHPITEIRVCAEGGSIRLRNVEAWLPHDQRQKLWLPLVLEEGKCSDGVKVKDGPQRVTHVAFEYESMGVGVAGAHVVIAGRRASQAAH